MQKNNLNIQWGGGDKIEKMANIFIYYIQVIWKTPMLLNQSTYVNLF